MYFDHVEQGSETEEEQVPTEVVEEKHISEEDQVELNKRWLVAPDLPGKLVEKKHEALLLEYVDVDQMKALDYFFDLSDGPYFYISNGEGIAQLHQHRCLRFKEAHRWMNNKTFAFRRDSRKLSTEAKENMA